MTNLSLAGPTPLCVWRTPECRGQSLVLTTQAFLPPPPPLLPVETFAVAVRPQEDLPPPGRNTSASHPYLQEAHST